MKSLSRRDALRTGAAAFAMAPIPAAAIAAMPVSTTATKPKDDANLLALIASVPAALDRHDEAVRVCREANERMLAELGAEQPIYCGVRGMIAFLGFRRTMKLIWRIHNERFHDERFDQASRKCGFGRAFNHMNAVTGQFRAVVRHIYATRAHTLEGIAAKQRLAVYLIKRLEYIESYEPVTWIASVSHDLEQIAGRA